MVKGGDTVIRYACPHVSVQKPCCWSSSARREFNELANVNSPKLKEWLGKDELAGARWSKDDGSGETVGHERY